MSDIISVSEAKAKYWRDVMAQQIASGQSIQAFCAGSGINHHTFRYWQAKLSKPGLVPVKYGTTMGKFMTVASPSGFRSQSPQIILPNGVRIDLGEGIESGSVRQFIHSLCGVGHAES